MRLIDADMIISELSPVRETALGIAFINVLETAPSVEVIRCKDCKFYKGLATCMIHGEKCGGTNYFCAWAERRSDG